jgi:drug/metabolite transporter (DMT)-like permease
MVAVVLVWGMSFVSSKAVFNAGFGPMTTAFVRFVIASLILFPLHRKLHPEVRISPGNRLPLLLSGLLGVSLYFAFENWGIKLSTASSSALIIGAIPVFVALTEHVVFKNRVSWYQGTGIGVSLAGVYLLVQGTGGRSTDMLAGNLLMLGACFSWVGYNLLSRNLQRELPSISMLAWQSVAGTIFLLPLALLEVNTWSSGGPVVWLNILYLSLFCSAAAYFLYLYGLKRLGAVVVSTWINLIPLIGALGGVIILRERLNGLQIAGGAVVLAGVAMVSTDKWRRQRHHSKST